MFMSEAKREHELEITIWIPNSLENLGKAVTSFSRR